MAKPAKDGGEKRRPPPPELSTRSWMEPLTIDLNVNVTVSHVLPTPPPAPAPDPSHTAILRLLREILTQGNLLMSGSQQLNQRLDRLADEVTETRTAADAVRVVVTGLRSEVATLRSELQNVVSPDQLARLDSLLGGFDNAQETLAQAAGVNIDPGAGGDTQPGGSDTVPAGEDTSAGADTVPAGEDTSAGSDTMPAGEDTVVGGDDSVPAGEDTVASGDAADEPAPEGGDATIGSMMDTTIGSTRGRRPR